jgi:uncharacterized repeat protein (TIGR01451 family)
LRPAGILNSRFRHLRRLVLLCLWILSVTANSALRTAGGTEILNTASISFTSHGQSLSTDTNQVKIVCVELNTPAELTFHKYAPSAATAEQLSVGPTSYQPDAGETTFITLSAPVVANTTLNLQSPLPCVECTVFHQSDYLFIKLVDWDENHDSEELDYVEVTLTSSPVDDLEVVRLQETTPNSGVFTGYIPVGSPPPTHYDGILSATKDAEIQGTYCDRDDTTDAIACAALVDPYGVVFDSDTGNPVDGASITLLNAVSGQPAKVLGDDGVSAFPSTIISGSSVTDAGGIRYDFDSGEYRFPFVDPGTYRLQVVAPTGFIFPCTVADATLQTLTGAPFAVTVGSRGESFTLNPGPALKIDLPMDSIKTDLHVLKSAGKDQVSIGDFLSYRLTVEHTGTGGDIANTRLLDTLPRGFRYQSGSARLDGVATSAPSISGDGRTLDFGLGTLASGNQVSLAYVVEVAAGARLGTAVNKARATGDGGQTSNVATAKVTVREDLLRSKATLLGRVSSRSAKSAEVQGVANVRIYMEDGTWTVTDKDGLYHFEGIDPGTHVVQLDTSSLPEQYVAVATPNTRFAGSPYSQFVDVQGGTLWRTDFQVATREKPRGQVGLRLSSAPSADGQQVRIALQGNVVPVHNVTVMLVLPEGLTLKPGSAKLDGADAPPRVSDNILIFRLRAPGADWHRSLSLTCLVAPDTPANGQLKALAMIGTAEKNNLRLPPAEIAALGESRTSEVKQLEIVGSQPGEQAAKSAKKSESDASPHYDKAWLASAKPGLEFLLPAAGWLPAIPSTKVLIKHDPRHKLTLLLNGKPVDPVNFDGTQKNPGGTLALSQWSGVDLIEGDNHFDVLVNDSAGRQVSRLERQIHYSSPPVQVEFIKKGGNLVADGKTPPVLRFRFSDKDGYPAREGVTGFFTVDPPYASFEEKEAYQKKQLIGLSETESRYTIGPDGVAEIRLEPTARSGQATLHFRLMNGDHEETCWLQPQMRDWILVGLAEGTAGYRTLQGHQEGVDAAELEEQLYSDGRIAFFAKGRIRGKWLLTLAYDNDKSTGSEGDSLYQTIDPDAYYQLYGDASQQDYEAASAEKLYVKLERGQFYALFGDFDTGMTVTELSRYSRSLTGFKTELKSDRLDVTAFASDTNQAYVKDEIRGDGTSGLYHLSRQTLVLNSEKIRLETRDRFHSEVILLSQTLSRHTDYDIDYDAGTLFFKRPVMSRDENLDPIYIVVEYESSDEGDKSYTYGGRMAVKSKDQKAELGASAIHEGSVGGHGELYGLDASYEFNEHTSIRAEAAQSDTGAAEESSEGDAYLVELTHRGAKLDGKLYFRQQDSGFGLGQQNGSETGTRKFGGDLSVKTGAHWSVDTEAYHEDNLNTNAERDMASAKLRYTQKHYSLHSEILTATDRFDTGDTTRSNQIGIGGSTNLLNQRLTLRLDRWQSLGGANEQSDYPTRTLAGADWRLHERVTLFGEEELTAGENQDTYTTRIGLKSTPWTGGEVNTSLDQNISENGASTFATMGLSQTWKVTPKWTVDGSVDMSRTVQNPGDSSFNTSSTSASGTSSGEDYTALTLGAGYTEKDWSFTSRVERQNATSSSKWGIYSGIIGQVKPRLTMSLSTSISENRSDAGDEDFTVDLRLGAAYRPLRGPWILLSRTDLEYEDDKSDSLSQRTWRLVENLNANLQVSKRLQVSIQYGAKFVGDVIDGDSYSGFTDLIGLECRYDISQRLDLGFRTSVLHSWHSGQLDYSCGPSLGFNLAKNIWLSLGYNLAGFYDEDFSRINHTTQGPYVRFRLKFDQDSVKALKQFAGF